MFPNYLRAMQRGLSGGVWKPERDVLEIAGTYVGKGEEAQYAFTQAYGREFQRCAMDRVLQLNRASDYAWLQSPRSDRAKSDSSG